MNELTAIDPRIAVGLGALAGVIVQATRARSLERFIPPLALVLIVVGMFGQYPIPAPLGYALVGAGAVVSVIRAFAGGK